MLKNPAYVGQAAFGKTRYVAFHSCLRPQRRQKLPKSRTITTLPVDQWQSIPVSALVDLDLYETVRAQLQENRAQARTQRLVARYLLQGLLVYKQCGYAHYDKPLSRASSKGHVRRYCQCRSNTPLGSHATTR